MSLYELEEVKFSRSLRPEDEIVGNPGSLKAFGAVVYIRWKLAAGGWWSSLVMSKSKIGPKNRVSIPRMELDGAVLAKRLREFLLQSLKLNKPC